MGYSGWGHKESDTTKLLTLSLFFFQFSDTGGVLVQSMSSAPEPFTSTLGLPKSSLSVSTTLGTLIVCVCVCVCVCVYTHTQGQLPLTIALSSLLSLFSGYKSPFESKTHQRPMPNKDMTK